MSLKSAVEDFFNVIDHNYVDFEGQRISAGGGYSQAQYDAALAALRDAAGIDDPHGAGAQPKESDSK